jgi:hypothetical protein
MDEGSTSPSVVKINGIKADVFERLLTFIYTGATPDFKMHGIEDIYDLESWMMWTKKLLGCLKLQKGMVC